TRNNILNSIKDLSLSELNKIPIGFNNNVIWNVGHIVATQQLLCYKMAGLDMALDAAFIAKYMKGSFAVGDASQEELDYIVKQLKELPAKVEADYANQLFKVYNTYTKS
ncbi:MAG: DinB family protein, partial [Vicingaceae bacterium]